MVVETICNLHFGDHESNYFEFVILIILMNFYYKFLFFKNKIIYIFFISGGNLRRYLLYPLYQNSKFMLIICSK